MKLIDVHRVLISQSFLRKNLSGGCFSRELKPTIPVDDKNAIFLAPGCNAGTSTTLRSASFGWPTATRSEVELEVSPESGAAGEG